MASQQSIQSRIRAIILLISVVVLLASFSAFIVYETISFKWQMRRHLSTVAAVVADNSAAPLVFHNKQTAEEILAALKAEPDINRAVLYDTDGTVFATFPANLSLQIIPPKPGIPGVRFSRQALDLFQPIYQEGKPLGTLYLHSSISALYVRLWRYTLIAALILGASVAGAAILAAVLQRRISRPIVALTDTAQRVTRTEDYSVRAPRLSSDEIGLLADAFNTMMAKTQEHQTRLAEQARLLDLSFDAIFVLDKDRKIIYWNHGATEMYGFSRQEALGNSSDELLQTIFPEPKENVLKQFYRNNRWIGELEQTRKDGSKLIVISRWALDRDAHGKHAATLETNNDITERKQAQRTLEQTVADRTAKLRETIGELEAFSYSISHDMRAPLRAMAAYANAIREDAGPQLPKGALDYIQNIVSSATRMDQLITDVLAYSRVSRDQRTFERIDVAQLVQEVVSHFPELQPGKADIEIQTPIPRVIGDRASLGQCLSNLLINAVKFVAPGVKPRVRVRAEPAKETQISVQPASSAAAHLTQNCGDKADPASVDSGTSAAPVATQAPAFIRIWFEDNGIGIAQADIHRIFGMFERVHPREKFEGTGIGLAIVKKAVERMGGRVGVESEPGKGSRFWLELRSAR
ncbi:MAG: hypothetical protein C5B50_18395 [Verrucomicrobia bacterium]|nr:MAG: hypothetical protein C5B50_18395 [Verrucomicrobiota bacterium]